MKCNRHTLLLLVACTLAVCMNALSPPSLRAGAITYPVSAYAGPELASLRQWEQSWVGKKVGPSAVDGVKELVPGSLYQIMKHPDTWGEIWFEIVPYKTILPSPGDRAFTMKHAGSCRIGPTGELLNYASGTPFPAPQSGLEIAWNFECLNYGDNTHALQDLFLIDGKKRYDRKMVFDSYLLYFAGRREIPSTPELLPNPRRIFRASHGAYLEPASMQGSRSVGIKFIDRTIDYDLWSFSSATRRIVRSSTAQRGKTQGGTDSSSDDQNIYDGAIQYMQYKYLGRQELLLARHQNIDQLKKGHREGYCLPDGFQRERINTHVLECTHRNPNYLYSKQVWYVDPETWWILYADKYDRQGRLWRIFENANCVYTSSYNGVLIANIGYVSIIDVQAVHSTGGFSNYEIGGTGERYQPDYYTPKALQRFGY